MQNPRIRWWIASVVMLLIMLAVFGRSLISAAYVNAAAVVLTHAEGQSACALGLPYSSLQPAKRDQAIAFLRQALRWNTNNERAWRLTGEIALNQGDLLEASQAFARVQPRTVVFSISQLWQGYADTERGVTQHSQVWRSSGAERFLLAVGDCFNANEHFEQAQHYYTIARDDAHSMIASITPRRPLNQPGPIGRGPDILPVCNRSVTGCSPAGRRVRGGGSDSRPARKGC